MPNELHPLDCRCRKCWPHPRRGANRLLRCWLVILLGCLACWAALIGFGSAALRHFFH